MLTIRRRTTRMTPRHRHHAGYTGATAAVMITTQLTITAIIRIMTGAACAMFLTAITTIRIRHRKLPCRRAVTGAVVQRHLVQAAAAMRPRVNFNMGF